jgi:hypothetical protein
MEIANKPNANNMLLGLITTLCILNLLATGYLIKLNLDSYKRLNKATVERNVVEPQKVDELEKKLDKFFEKQDQELKKLFEER